MLIPKKVKVAFINPPHADWSLANNFTYLLCHSYYNHYGKYPDQVEWIPAPYKWNLYKTVEDIYLEIQSADIIMFSCYVWNYPICDELAQLIKDRHPEKLTLLGGPHIGTNEPELLASRTQYDHICIPTRSGEPFMTSLLDMYIEGTVEPSNIANALSTCKIEAGKFDVDYSVYEEHIEYLTEILQFAEANNIEPFIVLETTRGCPYKCVFCEWGGGINTKIIKKSEDIVQRDILAMKRAGFNEAYLTDANFGAFEERDLRIFQFAWDNDFHLTDISTMKSKDLERRKRLIKELSKIVGRHEGGISCIPTVSIQSVSEAAMKIADRVDLSCDDKLELSRYINKICAEEGYPIPALELILAMPGSTMDDFYSEMDIIWNFKAWTSYRHDYMFLPDSRLNSQEYKDKYGIETVEVYSDIVDEDGTDNRNTLYLNKQTHFKTIRSCFSFTGEEMKEMWFMNSAANYLLKEIYPGLVQYVSPSKFSRVAYKVINMIEGFDKFRVEIDDLFDSTTPPRSIRKLDGEFRVIAVEKFLSENNILLRSEISRLCMETI